MDWALPALPYPWIAVMVIASLNGSIRTGDIASRVMATESDQHGAKTALWASRDELAMRLTDIGPKGWMPRIGKVLGNEPETSDNGI